MATQAIFATSERVRHRRRRAANGTTSMGRVPQTLERVAKDSGSSLGLLHVALPALRALTVRRASGQAIFAKVVPLRMATEAVLGTGGCVGHNGRRAVEGPTLGSLGSALGRLGTRRPRRDCGRA